MKVLHFVVLAVAVVAVTAEPPRYRQARFRPEQQELAPKSAENGEKEITTKKNEAPYEAAGFKPSKEFNLPQPARQEITPPATSYGVPADSYGAPLNAYLTPSLEYGVPELSEHKEETTEATEKKEETKEEKPKEGEQKEKLQKDDVISVQGAYYVLLPDAQLQRVQFRTENDLTNMAYTAKLQYRNENAPVYVYTAVPQQYPSAGYFRLA